MLPKYHIILGAIISITFYFIFQLTFTQVIIIFLASFLIDVDHYLWYIYKKRSFNLMRAMNWFRKKRKHYLSLPRKERKQYKKSILIFHGIEILIITLILFLVHQIFLFIFLGILIHLLIDLIEFLYIREPFYSKFSQIVLIIKNKKKTKDYFFK